MLSGSQDQSSSDRDPSRAGRTEESTSLTGTPSPEVEAVILAVSADVFGLGARHLIRVIERMARSRGSLSIRWQ